MKKHSIENDFLKISVKETGAELCSIINKENDIEYIWQADPKIWGSHAPNLFPIIGEIKNGKYFYEGKEYSVPKHGFIRHNENIRLKERSEHQLVFELLYSEETLEMYPFKFDLRIAFTIDGKNLEVSHHLINLDEKPIYFSLGGHPAFNIQLFNNENIDDYSLQFDRKMDLKTYILNDDGLVSSETKEILKNDHTIKLTENIFDEDALIFKNINSNKVDLVSAKHGKILSVEYKDFKNLGIWAKPGAPYVCIEPWLGIADVEDTNQNLKDKEGIEVLNEGEEINHFYMIQIN
ncbi:aldose 1-epimerase family protein [Christiangramia sp. SM2212]|uniref:Aldose 1-epimerase family protein n=1 Tax=Christiangramia sediminicola TaxID=3073267 RepID=A0ABU1EQN2_9FLAO|nr:aldose 1-epimerase family protein [Christiangramia sp. SM2212]MDR5590700.1 aldose 1-epimerase family protein [Christiangramia sp. SM2212]